LILAPEYEKDLKAKLCVSIVGGLDVFRFSKNNETSFSSEEVLFHKQNTEDGTSTYMYGFNGQYLKSNFIELNSEVLNALSNTFVSVKLSMLAEAAAAPPAKGAKGAPPAPVAPTEEVLIEYKVPLHSLFVSGSGSFNFSGFLAEYSSVTCHSMVCREQSAFNINVSVDNELSGYVLGSRVLHWNSAVLSQPPHTWALHAPDVLDPKAKVQPTAADLRTKYIDNIDKAIESQAKIAAFKCSIGGADENAVSNEEEATGLMDYMKKIFTLLELSKGTISWNKQAALSVPLDEDIRQRGDLWTIEWSSSPVVFLHRSEVRKLTKLIAEDPTHAFVPLTIRKVPTPESVAVEGGEVFATGLVDLSGILVPGEEEFTMQVAVQGDLMDVSHPEFNITLSTNAPMIPKSSMVSFAATKAPFEAESAKIVSISATPTNKDALEDLRDEISLTLERIAQEYVSLYPTPLHDTVEANHQNGDKRDDAMVLEEQKLNFMKYLVNNGLFHDLQQTLRPKVQLLIRERYGAKGRALGKSDVLRQIDMHNHGSEPLDVSTDEPSIQSILSELYTFIIKECNVVLNAIFASTIVQKDKEDLENPAKVLEEPESYRQKYDRLLCEAEDALADGQYQRAEILHLERLQFIDHNFKLQSNRQILHNAYAAYAQFLLQYAAQFVYLSSVRNESTVEGYQLLLKKAREALTIATQNDPQNWETALLFASVLLELDQRELAGEILHRVLEIQRGADSIQGLDVAFHEFSGYESDSLVPIHPRSYAVLAAYFFISERALETRKALILASRSYAEGNYGETPVSSHGTPRRTIVLVLAETAQYLIKFGQFHLAHACVRLAKDCERAGTEKAQARNKPAITPPYIKYMLKRAEAESTWDFLDAASVLAAGDDSHNPAIDGTDSAAQASLLAPEYSIEAHMEAKVSEAFSWYRTRMNNDRAVDCLIAAVQMAMDQAVPIEDMRHGRFIPLRAFLLLGRLLLQTGEWVQATKTLLYAAQIYTSASLCMLLGIVYLRLEKYDEAEQALLEANMLDSRHPDIWAYLCILCIQRGGHRLNEADACLFQTLRLQQSDPNILRELATAFMGVDKLQTAEDLIRRTIVLESGNTIQGTTSFASGRSKNSGAGAGSYNRKLLADILAGQNLAAKAIEEYQAVLQDEWSDAGLKLHAAQKCNELLMTLGRQEEIPAINQIISQLSAAVSNSQQAEEVGLSQ
jgi:Flp pilus assembly protein TadD